MLINEIKRYDNRALVTAIFHLCLVFFFLYLIIQMSGHPIIADEETLYESQKEKGRKVILLSQFALGALGSTWLYGIYNLGRAIQHKQKGGKRTIAAFLLFAPLFFPVVAFMIVKLLG